MFKIKKHIIYIFLLFLKITVSGQYVYEWNDYYGGDGMDEVASMVKTYDDNIFIMGSVKDTTDGIWIVKIAPNGVRMWSRLYTKYPMMRATKIIESNDKNLILTGIVAENDSTAHKIFVVKMNTSGEVFWEKLYNGRGNANSTDIIQTYDKGYAISGYTSYDVHGDNNWYILKIDSLGNTLWDKSFGLDYDDRATSLTQLFDSTLVVGGYITYADGAYKKGSVSQFSKDGIDLWVRDFRRNEWFTVNSVASTSDSCFVLAAEEKKDHFFDHNIVVMKMTANGDTIWTKEIIKPMMEHPVSIIETYDQGYAVAYSEIKDGVGNTNVAVTKLSFKGEVSWERIFERKSDDYASQLIEDANNALMIGASTYSIDKAWNFGVLKFKSLEMSDMFFMSPIATIATVYTDSLPVSAKITGYKKPVEVKVYVNLNHVSTITNFDEKDITFTNEYSWEKKIQLNYGLNIIDFIVTDYKDFTFIKTKKIYYLPNSTPHW